jgi:arabinose-5-phosphate isomerase
MAISQGRLGATLVVDGTGALQGIVTDGDLRRMLEKHQEPFSLMAMDILTPHPKTVAADALAYDALRLLEANSITQLVVLDAAGKPAGMIHLHDILNEGIR